MATPRSKELIILGIGDMARGMSAFLNDIDWADFIPPIPDSETLHKESMDDLRFCYKWLAAAYDGPFRGARGVWRHGSPDYWKRILKSWNPDDFREVKLLKTEIRAMRSAMCKRDWPKVLRSHK